MKKCTKIYNARAQPLHCSLNLAIVVFLNSVLSDACTTCTLYFVEVRYSPTRLVKQLTLNKKFKRCWNWPFLGSVVNESPNASTNNIDKQCLLFLHVLYTYTTTSYKFILQYFGKECYSVVFFAAYNSDYCL